MMDYLDVSTIVLFLIALALALLLRPLHLQAPP